MLTVQQLLNGKSINTIYTVTVDQMVIEALELMAEKNIGALMIMEDGHLAGIFSERDYARKGIIKGRKAKSTSMREVMTPNVITVSSSQSIEVCMQLMSSKKIRHLPVVDNGEIKGILSISDIVTAIIREQAHRIQNLEQYISGSY
jgi:CBS domain-containing protein